MFSVVSVSYTHLDVYKRQSKYRPRLPHIYRPCAMHKSNTPQQIKHERRLKPVGREYELPTAQQRTIGSYAIVAGRHGAA